jgi:hypothetical protein
MASELPGYTLRNCTIFVDRESKAGQASEMTLPVPTEKVEEIRNAGMVMPIEVKMGYELMEHTFSFTAFDPSVLQLFGLKIGDEREFMVTGALADEDGTVHNAVAYVRGFLKSADAGSWTPGEMGSTSFAVSIRYYKLEVDGVEIFEMDPFSVSVGGTNQTEAIRNALLLS